MQHPLLLRAALGSAGLAACLMLLSGAAKAADGNDNRPIYITRNAIPPNFAGTMTIPITPDRYLDNWERARRDDRKDPALQHLVAGARQLMPDQQIYYIQAAVPKVIRWRSDATEWGRHDYWASAAETLQHGYGDDEDRAIVKMQGLLALGFSPRNLYLTMGKDRVGGPETVLVVRQNQVYYVLDDTDGPPYPTSRRPEFTPMLSFGYGGFWIHGYPHVTRPAPGTRAIVASAAASTTAQ